MTTDVVDFDAFLPTEDFVLDVMQDGKRTGWQITLGGPEHPKAVAFADAQLRQGLERARLARLALANGSELPAEQKEPDEARRENVAWMVARIIHWTPIRVGGKEYPFSDDAAFDLLTRPTFGGVVRQISKALEIEARFLKRSA